MGMLNFIFLGTFSQRVSMASSFPPPLFHSYICYYLGSSLSPITLHVFSDSLASGEELAPEVLCFLRNMPLSPLWNCPEEGRRACPVWIWKGNGSLLLPPLATGKHARPHRIVSACSRPPWRSLVGLWGLAKPPLLKLGAHPLHSATCNPSCLPVSWAQSTGRLGPPSSLVAINLYYRTSFEVCSCFYYKTAMRNIMGGNV